jgi:alpha-galactosidase
MATAANKQAMEQASQWLAGAFGPGAPHLDGASFPLSFGYDGQELAALLKDWPVQWTDAASRPGASCRTVTATDPHTGLQIRCEVTTFADFPAVEWVAYLKNTGAQDTPIIANIQALDSLFGVVKGAACTVHHARGSSCQPDDFEPLATELRGGSVRIASIGGRSSDGALPFFNLQIGDHGVIGAIGWSGGWAADFDRSEAGVRVSAGLQETHLRLHPGEEIRTPRILLVFWQGERLHGHNLLRRLIIDYHTPRPNGQMLRVPISDGSWGERATETQIAKVRWQRENNIGNDTFWIDAGWHGDNPFNPKADTFGSEWVIQVGNWWPNKNTYPQGLGPIGQACKEAGINFVLWFEPERVYQGTQFAKDCPQWLFGPIGTNYLFNLGIPEARQALTDKISQVIAEGGITVYRQDFNFQPYDYWRKADAPDRVGMNEIRHIEGLYAFWDELLARHPGLIIDNCASGGRRIDLETISRSVPLWRSDVQCWPDFDPITQQTQTHGLGLWVPLSVGCTRWADPYGFRSALGAGIVVDWATPVLENGVQFDLDLVRRRMGEEHATRWCFYGDFYPLCSFSMAKDTWAAWQFDRPDLGEGMVLALRRPQCPFPVLEARLQGLDAGAWYQLQSLDTGAVTRISGRDLMDKGINIELPDRPDSALYLYRRLV